MTQNDDILSLIDRAIDARGDFFDDSYEGAFRLFNGFLEGCPDLVVELYGRTAVIHNYAKTVADGRSLVQTAQNFLVEKLDGLRAVLVKTRRADTVAERNGILAWGTTIDTRIREHGVRYAINLTMNQDTSFYLDTRGLRQWLQQNMAGRRVLNTFAYTGSLGVAAKAAGAGQVIHIDLNRQFLNIAKTSYTLNGFPISKKDFISGDFFPAIKHFNRQGERFDCVVLDPPFFSTTQKGTVDAAQNMIRLINKVRPLVLSHGRIVAINNALYTSGKAYLASLNELCQDGYVAIEALIDIEKDFTGFAHTRLIPPITDPAPFNHSTKIAVLKIQHK